MAYTYAGLMADTTRACCSGAVRRVIYGIYQIDERNQTIYARLRIQVGIPRRARKLTLCESLKLYVYAGLLGPDAPSSLSDTEVARRMIALLRDVEGTRKFFHAICRPGASGPRVDPGDRATYVAEIARYLAAQTGRTVTKTTMYRAFRDAGLRFSVNKVYSFRDLDRVAHALVRQKAASKSQLFG